MIKLLIGLLIIACILPLFIKGPDGKPIMTLDDWKPEVPEAVSELADQAQKEASGPTKVYKWQDENGQWHFTNRPPEVPQGAEEMELSGDINIMDAYEAPPEQANAETTAAVDLPGMTVAPDQVKEMMDTVNNLQQDLEDRKKDIDRATGN